MDNELLSRNIKIKCSEKQISVAQLEKILGFSTGAIGKWGQSAPSIEKVIAVAEFFQISLDELCGIKSSKEEKKFMECLIQKTRDGEMVWFPCSGNERLELRFFPARCANDFTELYRADFRNGVFYLGSKLEEIFLYISLQNNICMEQHEDVELIKEIWDIIKEKEQEVQEEIIRFKEQFVSG